MTVQEAIAQAYQNGYEAGKRAVAQDRREDRERLIEIIENAGSMRQFPGTMARILIENGVTFIRDNPVGVKQIPTECPKCGRPLSLEYGTYYCHWCKIMIYPLDLTRRENNG